MQHYRSLNAVRMGAVWIFGFVSVLVRVNPVLLFADLELNGMSSSDVPDVPPPLPLKGSMADYGNLMESQDLISPTTSPPAHQRVSPGEGDRCRQSSLLFTLHAPQRDVVLLVDMSADPEISAVAKKPLECEGTASLMGTNLKGGWMHVGGEDQAKCY